MPVIASLVLLGACVSSPLYTGTRRPQLSGAEVPRDARGDPILSEIRPIPGALPAAKPAKRHRSGHWFGLF